MGQNKNKTRLALGKLVLFVGVILRKEIWLLLWYAMRNTFFILVVLRSGLGKETILVRFVVCQLLIFDSDTSYLFNYYFSNNF